MCRRFGWRSPRHWRATAAASPHVASRPTPRSSAGEMISQLMDENAIYQNPNQRQRRHSNDTYRKWTHESR